MRNLIGLAGILVAFGVFAAPAIASSSEASVNASVGTSVEPSPFNVEPLNYQDCPEGAVCLWEGPTYGGSRAFFSGSETGCKPLNNISAHSVYDRSNHSIGIYFTGGYPPLTLYAGQKEANYPTMSQVCLS